MSRLTFEDLGQVASACELLAHAEENEPMEREWFNDRAEFYRKLQVDMLQDESKPYPLAMVLPQDRPVYRASLWVWAAVIAGVAVLALLMWL